jgi:hypothetical protein
MVIKGTEMQCLGCNPSFVSVLPDHFPEVTEENDKNPSQVSRFRLSFKPGISPVLVR